MPVINDKFDPLKIDKLKHFLEEMAAKGQPRPFEMFVDHLKVVPKTEDVKEFDNYEYYMNEDTEKIRILIYNTGLSPRNDQYCFYIQQHKADRPSTGLGEIDHLIQEKMEARDREHEITRSRQELEETKQRLIEAEDYIDDLENRLQIAAGDKYKFGNFNLLEFGVSLLGRYAERHGDVLFRYGLEGLAPGAPKELPSADPVKESEAHFQKKSEAIPQVKPEWLPFIPTLQEMDAAFDPAEMHSIMQIIGRFSHDRDSLQQVIELLHIQIS